jgi:hypothetical protein
MSTPEEHFEIAVDESSDAEAREMALADLETANECARLADVVRDDGVEDRYREQALTGLAHPQCTATLRGLAEDSGLPSSLQDRAEQLLDETPDDAGPT